MKKYILKRIAIAIITLLFITFVLFVLMNFLPGSPFNDERLGPEQVAFLRSKYGLDQPVVIRFVKYVANVFVGDFGKSYAIAIDTPISLLLKTRLPVSMRIGGQAILLGTALGLVLGIVAAFKHNTIWDTLAKVLSVIGVSIPSYVFGLGLSYFLGFRLKWFPILFTEKAPYYSSVLPTLSLCLFSMASISRFTRTELLEVLNSDYILFAESKGIGGFRFIFVHTLRNAVIPIITILAPLVVGLMTGSLVIERIFSVPGVGQLLVMGIQVNDYSVIAAMTFIYSFLYIGIMLIVDILYGIIDPRIRLAKEDGKV